MPNVSPKEVEKHLKGVDYPAKKTDLIKKAQQEGANEQIIKALQQMPGEVFNKPTDVTRAIGEERGSM